jgi:hypothetical protein
VLALRLIIDVEREQPFRLHLLKYIGSRTMSKMDIQDALERIKTATKESPLLLLTCGEKTNIICCFANTVMARQMIGQSNFIGIVDKTMDIEEVKKLISSKVREDVGKPTPASPIPKLPRHSKQTVSLSRGFNGLCSPFQA